MTNKDLALSLRWLNQDEDVEIFRAIRMEALHKDPDAFSSTAESWCSLSRNEWIRRMLNSHTVVALDGPTPIGLMGFLRNMSQKSGHRALVVMVYVRQAFRGTSTSKRLLEKLIADARSEGIRQLELEVGTENQAAIRFYLREGFSEIGRIPHALEYEGRSSDQILMVRRIA